MIIENRLSKMKFFQCQGIFFVNFDFNNGCKNEIQENKEKTCSRFQRVQPDSLGFKVKED